MVKKPSRHGAKAGDEEVDVLVLGGKKQMERGRQEVTTETYMLHTGDYDTWKRTTASHFYITCLKYISPPLCSSNENKNKS